MIHQVCWIDSHAQTAIRTGTEDLHILEGVGHFHWNVDEHITAVL